MELITLENEKVRKTISFILTILIILFLSVFIYFTFFINQEILIKILGISAVILIILIWLFFEYRENKNKLKVNEDKSNIKKFVLITRDGEREKEWYCEGNNSFLIGKGTVKSQVDIELGDTYYADYISNEHAVLNYSNGYWYIEDLDSANGVGLKKKNEEYSLRLKPMTSYKIDEGDIIYISKAKILVR